jgi:chromosomal replication initiation ATPase DnaA
MRKLIAIVENTCEIPLERIRSEERCVEVVDARHLLIYLLYQKGFYISAIASLLGRSHRAVYNAVTMFENRIKQSKFLRRNYEAAMRQL